MKSQGMPGSPGSRLSGLSPGRIALGYAVIASLWIAFSDAVVTRLNLPPTVMTSKGVVFVLVTASLLFFTIRRLVQFVQLTSQERDETARLYRTVVEASNEGICLLDESGRISFLNGRLAAMLGRPAEELQGKRIQDFVVEPDVLAQRGAQQSPMHECRLRTDSDRTTWVLISRYPVLNDAGEVVQLVGTVIDITERKRAEEDLRRTAAFLSDAQRLTRTGAWASDRNSKPLYWSEEVFRIFGFDPQQGMPAPDLTLARIHPEDYDKFLKSTIIGKADSEGEYRIALPDGTQKHVHGVAHPVLDSEGEVVEVVGVIVDITERKHAEDALRRVNRELRAISSCNQVLLRATDEQSLLQEVCRIVCEDAGYRMAWVGYAEHDEARTVRPVAWTGTDDEQLRRLGITWADTESGRGPEGTAIRTGSTSCLEDCATDSRGAHWKQSASQHGIRSTIGLPLKDEHGSVFGCLCIYAAQPSAFSSEEIRLLEELAGDLAFGIVTLRSRAARKRAEEEVRSTAAQWQATFDAVQDLILLLDKDYRILRANRAAADYLGLAPGEVVGGHCYNLIHGESAPPVGCPLARLRLSRGHEEEEVLAREGGPWLSVSVDPVFDANGELTQVVHVARDITERKRAEDELRRTWGYLAETQRLTRTGTWVADTTTAPLYWSEELFRILGFDPRQGLPTGDQALQRVHPDDLDAFRQAFERTISTKVDVDAEYRVVLPDGTVKTIRSLGHPVLNARGEVVELVGTTSDVTARRRAEDELRRHREHLEELVKQRTEQLAEAKAQADAANRAKSDFLANMSHEIRTPMNAVLGFAQLLRRDDEITPSQRRHVDTIIGAGTHLLGLIDEILQITRIEAGRVTLEETSVDLPALLSELQGLFASRAAGMGLRFVVAPDGDLPRYVKTDSMKLRQVLANLIGNALKFTRQGGVTVRAKSAGTRLVVEVEDSGVGIAATEMPRLFRKFEQTESGRHSKQGTGLGLAICREYIELMGGVIDARSEPGRGSVFRFEIPLKPGEPTASAPEVRERTVRRLRPGPVACRVLVVDDQEDNRLFLTGLLEAVGFETRQVADGEQALAACAAWQPQLVLMDMRMPGMGGAEAIRRIRATPGGAAARIVSVSASAFDEDRKLAIAAGADDFISKPFRESVLFEKARTLLHLDYEYAGEPAEAASTAAVAPVPDTVARLPAELRARLRQATVNADLDRVRALLEEAEAHDAEAAHGLRELAERFAYRQLLVLLQPADAASQRG